MFKFFKKNSKSKFTVFDKVEHEKLGLGIVHAVFHDDSCYVAFDKEIKRIATNKLKAFPTTTFDSRSLTLIT